MSYRNPKNFLIKIGLDSKLQFSYREEFSQLDASSLTVIDGDQIAWILDSSIQERTLQIDFGAINPFHIYHKLSLRGMGHAMADRPVKFPLGYPGNRQLKYSVSLGNGLHDDPDVVPVENDAGFAGDLSLQADFKISWTVSDPKYQSLILTPATLSKSAGGGKAAVTWRWNVDASDPTPPFHLHFISPPDGWQEDTDSTETNPAITLLLPPGQQTEFHITTSSGDGENAIFVNGSLTITS